MRCHTKVLLRVRRQACPFAVMSWSNYYESESAFICVHVCFVCFFMVWLVGWWLPFLVHAEVSDVYGHAHRNCREGAQRRRRVAL